jgi:hypothetical protein
MTRGIFFAANSFKAISSGSVSPSTGTRTGAFILLISSIPIFQLRSTDLICKALVPITRARSYFVMYGVVTRVSFGFAAFPVRFSPPSWGFDSSFVSLSELRPWVGAYDNHVLLYFSIVHSFLLSSVSCFHLLLIVANYQLLTHKTKI